MSKKVALIDMDGCLCRWDDSMIPALKSMEHPSEKGQYDYSDLWPLQDKYPHIAARANLVMSKQGFWTGLKPYESGMMLYKYISERFETIILTKARKNCSLAWKEKVDWIHRYIGDNVDIMVVTTKAQVKGDLMFDDLPENCHKFLKTNPDGKVIMPIRRYNVDRVHAEPRISVWNDEPMRNFDPSLVYDFSVPYYVIDQVLKGE